MMGPADLDLAKAVSFGKVVSEHFIAVEDVRISSRPEKDRLHVQM